MGEGEDAGGVSPREAMHEQRQEVAHTYMQAQGTVRAGFRGPAVTTERAAFFHAPARRRHLDPALECSSSWRGPFPLPWNIMAWGLDSFSKLLGAALQRLLLRVFLVTFNLAALSTFDITMIS